MIHGDDQSRLLEDISAAEERITRYINTNRAEWGDPHEAKLAGMIAELEALYEDAGINIFDRRYSAEDVDAAFRVAADTKTVLTLEGGGAERAVELAGVIVGDTMSDAERAHWYRWAYITVSDNPGMSVLVADKLRSLGLPIYKHEIAR
jgi:hypothetical protein